MQSQILLLVAALGLPASASADDSYPIAGYVTAVSPTGGFDIEGAHILVTPSTKWEIPVDGGKKGVPAPASFYLGESLNATGKFNRATDTLTASEIVVVPPSAASVKGVAIIDLIPPAVTGQPATDRMVRADGYLLHITEKTKLKFAAPLTSIADVATNQWIDYQGVQQLDGTVLLNYAGIRRNAVDSGEAKLIKKTEYDPEKVTDADRQSGVSKFFKGTDVKRIPPAGDADMLARVQRIGNSLIPAFQRALAEDDPAKIHFRFQVIDSTKWRDAVQMPSGIIVVPRQVVERMQNDDQLATVLADNIAEALEKDTFRIIPTNEKVTAANVAGTVAGIFIPGVGLATQLAGGGVQAHVISMQLQQSGRVSLGLLHDAGYDIRQAPLAWWLLASKSPKPLEKVGMPPRAATLYMALGTTWRPVLEAGSSPATDAKRTN